MRGGGSSSSGPGEPVSPGTAAALRAAAGLSPGRRRSAAAQQGVVVTFASGALLCNRMIVSFLGETCPLNSYGTLMVLLLA
jgi:hypothetical protein